MTMDLIIDFPQNATSSQHHPRVSFDERSELKFVDNLATEYRDAIWYTETEMKSFKVQMALLVRSIRSSDITVAQYAEKNASDTSVFMGLEQHLSEITYKVIIDRRRASWNAVRTEERRQISLGIYDPHEMMKVVRVESEHSEKRARIVGLLHADKR